MLEKSMQKLNLAKRRMWSTLRRRRTWAERIATEAWRKTALFEPFGGSCTVTRIAAEEFGWTCTQPMDKEFGDQYDLLKPEAERQLFEALEQQDPYLTVIAFPCWMFSVMANMNKGIDWESLRKTVGRKLLRLVKKICLHRMQRGRYFLVENPATACSWTFEEILTELMEKDEVYMGFGDQ